MAKILNTLLGTLSVFFVCYLWIVYCLKDSLLASGLAAIVASASGYLLFRMQSELDVRKSQKKMKLNQITALGEFLRFGKDNALLFEQLLSYYRFDVKKTDPDNLIAIKNNTKSYVALRYTSDTVTKEQLTCAIVDAKRAECEKLFLFAHKMDKSLIVQTENVMPITFVDVANVYALLEQADKLPQLNPTKKRKGAHIAIKYVFSRKRFGLYLATTLFMLALSVVSYIKWYTLSWATVSLVAALYSLLNRRFNTQPTSVTLN